MTSPFAAAQARASCHRCHRRKKKCDRSLPQCENCRLAGVACSFLQDDRQVASYPVAFVRGLQEKVKNLEEKAKKLEEELAAALESTRASTGHGTSLDEFQVVDTSLDPPTFDFANFPSDDIIQPDSLITAPTPSTNPTPSASLVQELKSLSLEAAAERHLGSSSGVSFAKLTQLVLRRLSPDKAEFVFENTGEPVLQQPYDCDSPSDALDSILHNFNNSLSCYPTLYTDFSLSDITESANVLAELRLPEDPHLSHLVNFYFAHSHTLYPIVSRKEFLSTLHRLRSDENDPLWQSPLCMFRIWIVLAIGATSYASVTLGEESEPMSYYSKAMLYFEPALDHGEMATLEVLTLQVSYSFFSQLGPNTWFLVGTAARIAVGMGLHASSSYEGLPRVVAERRKRIFFSIYMMDRMVSMALGRPFALHDDDIDITPFVATSSSLTPSLMSIPRHILTLRRLASKIATKVYSSVNANHTNPQEDEAIIHSLHAELIEWRRNAPFPLPDAHPQVPQMSSSWYDFNFYTHLALLYRPSPLLPTLDKPRVKILADAAAMAIRQAVNMHAQRRFAYNWLNFLALFTSVLSLIYAITAFPDNLAVVLKETRAIEDLESANELFGILRVKFPAASKIGRMIEEIVVRYKGICQPEGL